MRNLHRSLIHLSCLVSLGVVLPSSPVMAQSFPVQANPGVLTPDFNMPAQSNQVEPDNLRDSDRPNLDVPQQPPIVNVDKDTFQVNHVEVSGNTIVSDNEMRKIVSPYEGRELSAEDLAKMVSMINDEYRSRGFLTSLAFVPPQDLERGTITIKVLEGMIGDMELQGNKYFKAKVIEKRISEKPGDPLNIPQLEKELLRINRQEPYRLKATLSPGEKTGETKVHLDVQEQQPFQIGLTADNAGRPYIGMYRGGIDVTDRNVTGHGDRFNARYLIGAGQQIASTYYTLPVGSHGTEVSGLFGFSHVNIDLNVSNQPEIVGNAYNYGFLVSQPLDKERTFVADLGLNARHITTYYDHDKSGTTDIRSATLGLTYNKYDRWGRTVARTQATFAPEWLGANTSFFKFENYLTRVNRLPKGNLLILRAYSQLTPDALPAAEQFQLGGLNTVRGFTEGTMLGDRGYNLNAEWRWPIPMLSHVSPWLGSRLSGAFFIDHGQAWIDKDNRYYSLYRNRPTSLTSVGFGARAHLTDYLQGYIDVAFGLGDRKDVEPERRQPTARIHFGVRSELLPNDYKTRSDVVTPIKTNVFRPRSVGALRSEDLQTEVADPTLEPVD